MHKISIRIVVLLTTLMVTLSTMVLYNAVFGNLAGETFTQMDLQIVTQNVEQAKAQLDELIGGARSLSDYITQSVLMQRDASPLKFRQVVDPLVENNDGISSIVLYKDTGSPVSASTAGKRGVFLTAQSVREEEWFRQALNSTEMTYSAAHLEHSYRGEYTWVVTLARRVTHLYADAPQEGVLAVNLRLKAIEEICSAYSGSARGSLMVVDNNGMTIYSPRGVTESLAGVSEVFRRVGLRTESQQMLQISQPLENEQWMLVGLTREGEITESSRDLQQKGLMVLAMAMGLAVVLSWLIANLLCRPFRHMERAMHCVESGVAGMRLEQHGYREFVSLTRTYNGMLDRIESLMAESREKQEQLRSMEIAALEEQINPHFLYNALDSIVWLIETDRGKDAVTMVDALARLMRLSINRGGNFHTVSREVEHIRNYLIIQKTRYGQRFESHIHVEKDTEALLCPRLILQPIVENAIKHGIAENEDCQVVVRVFLEGENLVMTVWDDGMGLVPAKLREVQEALRETLPPDPDQINGLALKSINRRIRLLCGEQYGITIESETEEWTCVKYVLPCRRS